MNLVVGLGNWGAQFDGTRHNVGYDVITALMNRHSSECRLFAAEGTSAESVIYKCELLGAILAMPITGMNNSGQPIKSLLDVTGLAAKDVILIYDDMDFEPGTIKIKSSGSHGRHNGVKSVIENIGQGFTRVRLGIGKPRTKEDGIDFVLGKFNKQERKVMDDTIITAMGAVEHILKHGRDDAMNLYNRGASKNV